MIMLLANPIDGVSNLYGLKHIMLLLKSNVVNMLFVKIIMGDNLSITNTMTNDIFYLGDFKDG